MHVLFQDQALARGFTIEFDEMWSGKFGPDKVDNTPHLFNIGGREVELFFSPSDGVEDKIKEKVKSADYDLYFALLTWTRFNIADDMVDEVNSGVWVAGMVNDTASSGGAPYLTLAPVISGRFLIYNQPHIFHPRWHGVF